MINNNSGIKNILVLGSSGLIGSALVKHLEDKGHSVTQYDIKRTPSEDLTNPNLVDPLRDAVWKSDFVYFLAFNIGGSKYLENNQSSYSFIDSNTQMMMNVFQALSLSKTPFIFASSMMAKMPWSSYGNLKRLGEEYTTSIGCGKSVRFWNVYGYEEPGEKSHVIPDFCRQATREMGVEMITTGAEVRQFMHVDDAVTALEAIRERGMGVDVPNVIDVSSGRWESITSIAKDVLFVAGVDINSAWINQGTKVDNVQQDSKFEPDLSTIHGLGWKLVIPTKRGIKMVLDEVYKENKKSGVNNV